MTQRPRLPLLPLAGTPRRTVLEGPFDLAGRAPAPPGCVALMDAGDQPESSKVASWLAREWQKSAHRTCVVGSDLSLADRHALDEQGIECAESLPRALPRPWILIDPHLCAQLRPWCTVLLTQGQPRPRLSEWGRSLQGACELELHVSTPGGVAALATTLLRGATGATGAA